MHCMQSSYLGLHEPCPAVLPEITLCKSTALAARLHVHCVGPCIATHPILPRSAWPDSRQCWAARPPACALPPPTRAARPARAHQANERGNADSADTAARCSRYSVAAKSRHFFARPTCAPARPSAGARAPRMQALPARRPRRLDRRCVARRSCNSARGSRPSRGGAGCRGKAREAMGGGGSRERRHSTERAGLVDTNSNPSRALWAHHQHEAERSDQRVGDVGRGHHPAQEAVEVEVAIVHAVLERQARHPGPCPKGGPRTPRQPLAGPQPTLGSKSAPLQASDRRMRGAPRARCSVRGRHRRAPERGRAVRAGSGAALPARALHAGGKANRSAWQRQGRWCALREAGTGRYRKSVQHAVRPGSSSLSSWPGRGRRGLAGGAPTNTKSRAPRLR